MKQHAGATPQNPAPFAVVRPRTTGRPRVQREPWTKVTMHLADRHIAYLDLVTVSMRLKCHRPVPRAEIVQALVEFMQQSEIDFARFSTIEEMTESLAAYFRQIPNRGRMPLLESELFAARASSANEEGRDGCFTDDMKTSMGAVVRR